MDDETEVIKQQMAHTRDSLHEKVEALENKVMDTVHGAADTVSSAVATVTETVATVQDTVSDTVATVKEGVSDTVDAVKDAFDFRHHVQRYPWQSVACSIAVGFFGTLLLTPRRERRDERWPEFHGRGNSPVPLPAPQQFATQPTARQEPGWFDEVMHRFEPAMDKLKELAIGAATGLVSDMILQNVPQHLHADVSSVIDQFANAIGGKPVPHAPPPSPLSTPEANRPHNRLSKVKGNGRSV